MFGVLGFVNFTLFLQAALASLAIASNVKTTAILVDKSTNLLRLAYYQDGKYEIFKTYHATLGKVKGDKEEEGDLKTPEGIYTFKALLTPPGLLPKFGSMAFYLNYPNTYDQMAGRTGTAIMLHSTDAPSRLKQNFDSEGCVVVNNDEIKDIKPYIRLGLTPILIFPELTESKLNEYLIPGKDQALLEFFKSWIASWESKDSAKYITHYHTDFSAQGMDKAKWLTYKSNLNSKYKAIKINPEDVRIYRHPKYGMITFSQNYYSTLKSGGVGHRSRGTKILYIAEEVGAPKIVSETYTGLMW